MVPSHAHDSPAPGCARYSAELDELEHELVRSQTHRSLFGEERPLVFAGHQLESRLGRGAAAVVFAATNEDGEPRALKVLRAGAPAAMRERMRREADAASRIEHPNVVRVYAVDEADSRVVLVMERAATNLRTWLDAKPETSEIQRVLLEAARGLEAAHDAGFVHRDFKPDNVLLRGDGSAAVADFGLVREEGDAQGLTHPGSVLGTPAYMSPEQLRGDSTDTRTDVYSWGITACESLYGTLLARPGLGAATELPALDRYGEIMPANWLEALTRAVDFSRRARFDDAGDLLRELSAAS